MPTTSLLEAIRYLTHFRNYCLVSTDCSLMTAVVAGRGLDYSKTKLPSFQTTAEELGSKTILLNIDNVGIVTV